MSSVALMDLGCTGFQVHAYTNEIGLANWQQQQWGLMRLPSEPEFTYTVTFLGLAVGTDVVVLAAGTTNVLASFDQITGTSYVFTYTSAQSVDVGFLKAGKVPQYIRGLYLGTTSSSIPVAQTNDRNYI